MGDVTDIHTWKAKRDGNGYGAHASVFIDEVTSRLLRDPDINRLVDEKIIRPYLKFERSKNKRQWNLYFFLLMAALLTMLLIVDWSRSRVFINTAKARNEVLTQQQRIVDKPILGMRQYNQQSRHANLRGATINKAEVTLNRHRNRNNLEEALVDAGAIVGPDVMMSNQLLNRFDQSVSDVSDKNAPQDNAWNGYQARSDLLIGLKIEQNKARIHHDQTFIFKRLFTDIKDWLLTP